MVQRKSNSPQRSGEWVRPELEGDGIVDLGAFSTSTPKCRSSWHHIFNPFDAGCDFSSVCSRTRSIFCATDCRGPAWLVSLSDRMEPPL